MAQSGTVFRFSTASMKRSALRLSKSVYELIRSGRLDGQGWPPALVPVAALAAYVGGWAGRCDRATCPR